MRRSELEALLAKYHATNDIDIFPAQSLKGTVADSALDEAVDL